MDHSSNSLSEHSGSVLSEQSGSALMLTGRADTPEPKHIGTDDGDQSNPDSSKYVNGNARCMKRVREEEEGEEEVREDEEVREVEEVREDEDVREDVREEEEVQEEVSDDENILPYWKMCNQITGIDSNGDNIICGQETNGNSQTCPDCKNQLVQRILPL